MKKNLFILSTCVVSILSIAIGLSSWTINSGECHAVVTSEQQDPKPENELFFYDIGPRFTPIFKADLHNMTSMYDFISEEEAKTVSEFKQVSVGTIVRDRQTEVREHSNTAKLTTEQMALLRSADYSSHFTIRGEYNGIDPYTGKMNYLHFGPHYTIVPEIQTKYILGKRALLDYFRINNKDVVATIDIKKLRPAKLYFSVSATGKIKNIRLDRPSGNDTLDNAMKNLLQQLPGKWTPAKNGKGEEIEQELVISFGMGGC